MKAQGPKTSVRLAVLSYWAEGEQKWEGYTHGHIHYLMASK